MPQLKNNKLHMIDEKVVWNPHYVG